MVRLPLPIRHPPAAGPPKGWRTHKASKRDDDLEGMNAHRAPPSADGAGGESTRELEAEIIPVAFERRQMGHVQEFLDSLVQVDELEFAIVFLGVHPQADDGAES
jgi:hypothetical protein